MWVVLLVLWRNPPQRMTMLSLLRVKALKPQSLLRPLSLPSLNLWMQKIKSLNLAKWMFPFRLLFRRRPSHPLSWDLMVTAGMSMSPNPRLSRHRFPKQLLELAFAGCLAPARMGPSKFPKRPFRCTKIWIKGETLRKCLNVAHTVQLLGKMVDL